MAKKTVNIIGNAHWSSWPNVLQVKQLVKRLFQTQVSLNLFGSCGPFCYSPAPYQSPKHKDLKGFLDELSSYRLSKMLMPKSLVLGINSAVPYLHLEDLLVQLMSKGYRCDLFSDCLFESPQYFLKLNAYIRCLYVLFPVADAAVFWDLTGKDAYKAYCANVLVLKQRLKLKLVVPVLPQSIDYLPETFEFAFQHQCDVVLLYCKKQFSVDELKHIHYFSRLNRCKLKQVLHPLESCLCKDLLKAWLPSYVI